MILASPGAVTCTSCFTLCMWPPDKAAYEPIIDISMLLMPYSVLASKAVLRDSIMP